ncbi:MAG: hypothetical protein IJ788_07200 [Oscillospiraceae bacterium]|nr:hypothetical protein [Oscillospiraceae bacterium]
MKAIVLEKRGGLAAVLREDGVFDTTTLSCEVGDTIEFAVRKHKSPWLRSAAAAVIALALLGGSYTYLSVDAAEYVSLDVGETSVEVSVNHLGRVIGVKPMNDKSADMALELEKDIRGKKTDDAVKDAVKHMKKDEPSEPVIAGVTSDNGTAEKIESAVREAVDETTEVHTFEVSRDERSEAEKLEMSGGRLAYDRFNEENPPEKPEEATADMTPESQEEPDFNEEAPMGERPEMPEEPEEPMGERPEMPEVPMGERPEIPELPNEFGERPEMQEKPEFGEPPMGERPEMPPIEMPGEPPFGEAPPDNIR